MKTFDQYNRQGGIDSYANYMGDTSIKDMLVFLGRNRDSDTLDNSNFEVALNNLGGESDNVQVHRFGHWACGWFELILINPKATDIIEQCENMLNQLSSYPVLDESDYSERQNKEVMDYWNSASIKERIYLCHDCKIPIVAARHNDAPYRYDRLYDCLSE